MVKKCISKNIKAVRKNNIFNTLDNNFGKIGFGWYYNITDKWIENLKDSEYSFVEINFYMKKNNEWSKPITAIGGIKVFKNQDSLNTFEKCYNKALLVALNNVYKIISVQQ